MEETLEKIIDEILRESYRDDIYNCASGFVRYKGKVYVLPEPSAANNQYQMNQLSLYICNKYHIPTIYIWPSSDGKTHMHIFNEYGTHTTKRLPKSHKWYNGFVDLEAP